MPTSWRTPVISDPIRVCELIVGLPDVNVLGVEDLGADAPLRLHIVNHPGFDGDSLVWFPSLHLVVAS